MSNAEPSKPTDWLQLAQSIIVDRLSSPLISSFVVSWCLWNYKFLVILFSAASVTRTFELIDQVAFPTTASYLLSGLVYPALSSAAYVFVYPFPARFTFGFILEQQRRNNALRQDRENEVLLSVEDSRKIRAAKALADAQHREDIRKFEAEIVELKETITSLTSQLRAFEPQESPNPEGLAPPVTRTQFKILTLLAKYQELDLIALSKYLGPESSDRLVVDIAKLTREGLVTEDNGYSSGPRYRLNAEGRALATDSDLADLYLPLQSPADRPKDGSY